MIIVTDSIKQLKEWDEVQIFFRVMKHGDFLGKCSKENHSILTVKFKRKRY